jgi:hypothetical protein
MVACKPRRNLNGRLKSHLVRIVFVVLLNITMGCQFALI